MVDEYSSEEEQVEAIKKWLKSHGPSIVVGIAVGLAAVGGWRYWLNYKQQHAEAASVQYTTLTNALAKDDLSAADSILPDLLENYSDSAYAPLAQFAVAKAALENDQTELAISSLRWIIDSSDNPDMIPIARLRLARLLLSTEAPESARKQLDAIDSASYRAEVEELSGDIYAALGQSDLARTAYEAAKSAAGTTGAGQLLQLKIDNLSSSISQ